MDCHHQTRVIRCTEENQAEFKALLSDWPELRGVIKGLQAQGMFPGLRCLQIAITGTPEALAKGLGAIPPSNSPKTAQKVQP